MSPTVADVLRLPEMACGRPRVVAGADAIDRDVRLVHVLAVGQQVHHDLLNLLTGGELILTYGAGWPEDPAVPSRLVDALAADGAAGLVVELVHRVHEPPPELVTAATRHGLPLIVLDAGVDFLAVSRAVHAQIIDAKVAALRASERVHRIFTDLSKRGASAREILAETRRLTERPVVLENLAHQVLVYDADGQTPAFLDGWAAQSRWSNWTGVDVAARGEQFGRLVLPGDDPVGPEAATVLERAAMAIALNRLVERDTETLERSAHGELLAMLLAGTYTSRPWFEMRAASLGVPVAGRLLLGLRVDLKSRALGDTAVDQQAARREDAERVAAAIRDVEVRALVASPRPGAVDALLALDVDAVVDDVLHTLASSIHRRLRESGEFDAIVGAGWAMKSIDQARRSLVEAAHAADSVLPTGDDHLYVRLDDVGARGLAHMLRDDPRLQSYVGRMLHALIEYDQQTNADLERVLLAFLDARGNKSRAAAEYGLSRGAFYERLADIEKVLALDLDNAEVQTSLHLAMLALAAMRAAPLHA